MHSIESPQSRRLGQRLASPTRALTAVLALAALAVSTAHADVVFTRTSTTGEQFHQYTATYTAPYTGNYTFGFNLTALLSSDASIFIDAVKVANGATTVFSDGFETPALATNTGVSANGGSATYGAWAFSNYAGILNGSPPNWGLAGPASIGGGSGAFTLAPADGTHQYAYLQAVSGTLGKMKAVNTLALVAGQTYTISFYQASRYDFGGNTTYTVTLDYVTPVVNWVNWTGTVVEGGVTKYVGYMNVPRTGGGSTTVNVKYTSPPQGIAFFQTSNGADYFAQGNAGSLGRNPARSPYTSAKVSNIPDGGGAASDKGDIIALQFAGTNTLEFTDASTGLPIAIASPVFAYVSLNGNGYGFDQDFDILSFGDGTVRDQGYFGPGTSSKTVTTVNGATQYRLVGTGEPHGALQFRGSFSTVTWQSLANEYWNGFTIGVAQLAADVPIANAGLDQTVTATSASGASVQLSGSVSGSTKTPFTFTWSGDFGTASGQNPTVTLGVGTHTITLTVTDAAGASDTDTVVITVLPNPAPVITSATTATGTYGAPFSYTITATNSPTSFGATGLPTGLTLNGAVISGTPTQSGTFSIGLSATNSGGTGTGSLALTINKATATFTLGNLAQTYDGSAKSITVTPTPSGVGYVVNYLGDRTNAGSCPVQVLSNDANYTGSASDTLVIAKANATVSVSGYTGVYNGSAHGATGSATGAGGSNLSASLNLGATFTNVPGGTAHWTFTGGANYNDQSGDVAIVINKANATVVVTPYSVTYDGSAHSATVASITGVNGETGATVGTVTVNSTHTNAGTYATDSWSLVGAANYNNASGTITDTIAKANATVVVTPYNAEYDALAHSATVASITGVNGEAGATVGTVTLNSTHTAVGTYTDSWSLTGTANYNNASGTITDVIKDTTPPAITATMTPRGGGDDESSQFFTLAFSATDLAGVKTLTAVLNGVTVTNGQVVQLQTIKSGAQTVKRDDGKLQIKATSFALVVTATDVNGNTSTKTVVPVFVKNGKDSEDKKSDDKNDDKKNDKKGS